MPRPRQVEFGTSDCVMVCFQEITGIREDLRTATLLRFARYLNGKPGISSDALRAALDDAGWSMFQDPDNLAFCEQYKDVPLDNATIAEHWRRFAGEGVLFHDWGGTSMGHAVVVRSGGIIFDPDRAAPEEGEFILDYLGRRLGNGRFYPLFRVEHVADRTVDFNARLREFMRGRRPMR